MKSTRFVYDQLRDIYNLICEEEYKKKTPPSKPIKKKNPTFEKSAFIKYGSNYADQGGGGSRIRQVEKSWDEAVDQPQTPKRKTLKQFREDAGSTRTPQPTARDKKNLDFMQQVFRSAKVIDDFDLWVDFVNHQL